LKRKAALYCEHSFASTLNTPVEDIVVLVTLTGEKVTEQLAQIGVVRLVIKLQGTGIVQEDTELKRSSVVVRLIERC
jgi:hypothetical protein